MLSCKFRTYWSFFLLDMKTELCVPGVLINQRRQPSKILTTAISLEKRGAPAFHTHASFLMSLMCTSGTVSVQCTYDRDQPISREEMIQKLEEMLGPGDTQYSAYPIISYFPDMDSEFSPQHLLDLSFPGSIQARCTPGAIFHAKLIGKHPAAWSRTSQNPIISYLALEIAVSFNNETIHGYLTCGAHGLLERRGNFIHHTLRSSPGNCFLNRGAGVQFNFNVSSLASNIVIHVLSHRALHLRTTIVASSHSANLAVTDFMRQIESSYYELERLRNTPLSLPSWVDPTYPLFISTSAIPVVLLPYKPVFRENLATLMRDCGFNAHQGALQNKFLVHEWRRRIWPVFHKSSNVQDEFSTMQIANMASPNEHEPGSTFSATDFERLMSRGMQGSDTTVGDPSDGAEECTN
ncbi:hypothetical protein B0H14DRAFT_3139035 [Mycena olivaceomarginata]|nr:hypothetical protein B0H14DRAFT_3139035 [Mycena olivaceomarginata]